MIDRVPDGDTRLRPRTYTAENAPELLASDCLFARKFDETVDADVLDIIDVDLRRIRPQLPIAAQLPARTPHPRRAPAELVTAALAS
ncbi:hypothetical protein OIU35_22820 [Boseaceae bacterium BT-24-1]|nr:hypothetical protein [Boseaceae bacterium BT-24-1]